LVYRNALNYMVLWRKIVLGCIYLCLAEPLICVGLGAGQSHVV